MEQIQVVQTLVEEEVDLIDLLVVEVVVVVW